MSSKFAVALATLGLAILSGCATDQEIAEKEDFRQTTVVSAKCAGIHWALAESGPTEVLTQSLPAGRAAQTLRMGVIGAKFFRAASDDIGIEAAAKEAHAYQVQHRDLMAANDFQSTELVVKGLCIYLGKSVAEKNAKYEGEGDVLALVDLWRRQGNVEPGYESDVIGEFEKKIKAKAAAAPTNQP